ncbi:hypothetical protein V2J09_016499 [Rumex salicifolius]
MMTGATRFLMTNGVVLPPGETPPVSTLLEAHPGAYTTTRTHAHTLLFWDRHVRRLSHSLHTLLRFNPNLLFGSGFTLPQTLSLSIDLEQMIRYRFQSSLSMALPDAMEAREFNTGEELAVTALVAGNRQRLGGVRRLDEETVARVFDVFVHIGMYVPAPFDADGNWARLAVVCGKRDLAMAKYSDWSRQRKSLDSMRPSSATELLLSDDGDRILEGTVTNFYAVCLKVRTIYTH